MTDEEFRAEFGNPESFQDAFPEAFPENIPEGGEPQKDKKEGRFKRRYILLVTIFALGALYVLWRYFKIMMIPEKIPQAAAAAERAERGAILDRNGALLAMETRLGNVSVSRDAVENVDELAAELSPILEMGERDIKHKIENSQANFLYVKKNAEQSAVQKINAAQAAGRLKGVRVDPVPGRIYPEKNLAAQIVGFTGSDGAGLAGIEYSFDGELAPKGSRNGSTVVLTIDANIQHILEGIAQKALDENKAEQVMILAAEPRTGDILGAASLPGFDPNDINAATEFERTDRVSIYAYEPGSVFKVFSIASLLEGKAINQNTVYTCTGRYERTMSSGDAYTITCLVPHGRVSPEDIIVFSCNTGAANASERMKAEPFRAALTDFGFGSRTGAGTPGETAGALAPLERWSGRSKPTIAFGQEILVSALQIVQAATVIANDGVLAPPRFVSRIVGEDGTERMYQSGEARRVISPETAQLMRTYMEAGTYGLGIGKNARVSDIALAVKTGTAEIIDPKTRRYSKTDFIASCLALLPAEDPSLIIYVAIFRPRGDWIYGSRIAAPAIRETAEALIDYMGIPRGRNPKVSHPGVITVPADETPVVGDTVPDFSGYSKRSLIPLLLRDDLVLDIRGSGWVRRQIPQAGTPFTPGMTIILELE